MAWFDGWPVAGSISVEPSSAVGSEAGSSEGSAGVVLVEDEPFVEFFVDPFNAFPCFVVLEVFVDVLGFVGCFVFAGERGVIGFVELVEPFFTCLRDVFVAVGGVTGTVFFVFFVVFFFPVFFFVEDFFVDDFFFDAFVFLVVVFFLVFVELCFA